MNIKNNQQGVTVFIAMLILSSVVVLAVGVSDLVVRTGKNTRQVGLSEIAYYAAETGIEAALYQIEHSRNVTELDGSSGNLDKISNASWSLELTESTVSSPYQITLPAGDSYQLELDFNGLEYPTSLTVSWSGGDVGAFSVDDANNIETLTSGSVLSSLDTKLYSFRATNNHASESATLILTASGGNLPVGILITATGIYGEQSRVIEVERSNWQVY